MVAPVVLDTLHVPLVDYCDYALALAVVDVLEEVLVTLVHEDLLHSGEEDICGLNIPVDQMLISAFLSEGSWACLSNLLSVSFVFSGPEAQHVLVSAHQVLHYSHSSFMIESLVCHRVDLTSHKLQLCSYLLSCFTSILNFQTWEPELKIVTKAEMGLEQEVSEVLTSQEYNLSHAPIVLNPSLIQGLV